MSERIIVGTNLEKQYPIVIEEDFRSLQKETAMIVSKERKIAIITDSNVEPLYGQEVLEQLKPVCQKIVVFVIKSGEEHKTLDTVKEVYKFLIEEHFDRNDFLVALGGGVTGDLCGFAAATYLRGIDFIQIPTTLLAQTDSSIGGKTGVDFDAYKNMVGAFHMPRLVYMNLSTLSTLPGRQFASGMAEVLKHGLIKDGKYYEWLIGHFYEINEKELAVLSEMIYKSCLIKKSVVEKDPTEKGERALLNFGHTLGHAIEKYMNFSFLHGECVALGCVLAAHISYQKKKISLDDYLEIRDMFVPFSLPISLDHCEIDEIIALTKSDKKMDGDHLKFVLLQKTGKAYIDCSVTEEEMKKALKEIIFTEEEE